MNNNVPQTGEETAENETFGEISAAEQEITEPAETEETAFEEIAGDTESAEEAEEETEETEESENGKEDVICPNCGREFAPYGHDYCRKCEKKLVRVKVPLVSYIAGAAAILVSLFAFIVMVLNVLPALQVFEGLIYESGSLVYPALDSYKGTDEVISTVQNQIGGVPFMANFVAKGSKLDEKVFKNTVKFYNPLMAHQYEEYIFTSPGAAAFKEKSKAVIENRRIYDTYQNMYVKIMNAYNAVAENENAGPEDGRKAIETIEKQRGKEGIDSVLVDLFEFDVAGMSNMGEEAEKKYLEMALEDQKTDDIDWRFLFINQYCDMLIRQGEDEKALTMLKDIVEEDKSALDPYYLLAKVYKSRGDTDNLKDIVYEYCANNVTSEGKQSDSAYELLLYLFRVTGEYEDMEETASSAQALYELIPEYNRQLALAYLSQGKYDEAFEQAMKADEKAYYRQSYYGDTSVMNEKLFATVYVTAFLCDKYGEKNTENADQIPDVLESFKGRSFSGDKVERIINGEADIKDILNEGGCDLI